MSLYWNESFSFQQCWYWGAIVNWREIALSIWAPTLLIRGRRKHSGIATEGGNALKSAAGAVQAVLCPLLVTLPGPQGPKLCYQMGSTATSGLPLPQNPTPALSEFTWSPRFTGGRKSHCTVFLLHGIVALFYFICLISIWITVSQLNHDPD